MSLAHVAIVCKYRPAMTDDLLRSAIEHWGPRFVSNGIDPSDFARVTSSLQRWEDWCARWSEAAGEHEALGRKALREGRYLSAGSHLAQASSYYHFAKFLFVQDLAQMRSAHRKAVECLDDALAHLRPPGKRLEVPYKDCLLPGIFRHPAGDGPWPAVMLIPGLDSAKEEFRSTEQLFLERGLATFSIDGPGQGEAEYDLPIEAAWEEPGSALLGVLAAQPEVDPDRIGVWGVSLGGYYAPRLTSANRRVRACIALSGPYDFGQAWDRLPRLTRDAFRVRARCSDEQTARAMASRLTLAGRAEHIEVPLQIVFGKQDRLIPWQQADRLASEASGPVEVLMFEDGNHVCNNITYRHRMLSADWMARQLGA